ncbi:circadian clock-controlled protein daywake [Rhagoletis pomonella]|uniref:circadian clock-controlled protein daywake n=1 Tax=Rhagoletis pomonella TaxID=28610 RepID=UPI00178123BB|nr:circadian clock-controlled protein daywake [Rhagoletis pomonella]
MYSPPSCAGVNFAMNKINLLFKAFLLLAIYCSASLAGPNFKKERVKLPSFVKICRRNDPNLDVCARKSLLALKDFLSYGIPELFIPPITPLVVPEIRMDQDSGAVYLHSIFKNITVNGLDDFTLNELHIDPEKMRFTLGMGVPKIAMDAKYVLKGKIMMMPLMGEGDFKANFTDVELNTLITAERYKKHGRVFAKVKDVKVEYTLGKTELHFSNLFNGDEALGERMNMFLNENWDSLSDELRPLMERSIAELVRASTVKIFDTYSFDDLLPE